MGQPFKMHVYPSEIGSRVKISGPVREDATLSTWRERKPVALTLDLASVTAISSTGIRVFRDWLASMPHERLAVEYCPKCIVLQINMIKDFLPRRTRILSFYVPYASASGEERNVLYREGMEFTDGSPELNHPTVPDSAGRPMEMDILPDRYFQFLTRNK